jgi:nucleoside phosphorylase
VPTPTDGPTAIGTIILTALPEEEEAVVRVLGNCVTHRWRGHDLHVGSRNGHRVLVSTLGTMGNVGSAQATEHAVAIWNPARIMIVGIAGGARGVGGDLRLGDVLVPDQVVGYEIGKVRTAGLERRYEVYRPSKELLDVARSVTPAEWAIDVVMPRPDGESGRTLPRAHFGPVFSGEKVIADDATMVELRSVWPKAIGTEMEGLGVALASYRGGPGFLLVKAVCDFADPAKDDDWHRYAAEAAARFAVAVLARLDLPTAGERRPQATPSSAPSAFPGTTKLQLCQRLDNWVDVADYFDVPSWITAKFRQGNEARQLWEYLEVRNKLFALAEALDFVDRPDLAELLRGAGSTQTA